MHRLAAIAALAAACAACGRLADEPRRSATPPNILLVTIDTWRADRLRPDITPMLSALAASGTTFRNARSAVPLTLPSHTTILTGLWPPAHGVRENGVPLSERHRTVAGLLKDRGYRTAAFVGAFVLDRRFGLASGFDVYDDRIPRDAAAAEKLEAERPASAVVDTALNWLESQHPGPSAGQQSPAPSPFFLWLHVYDPHAPYIPHPDSPAADRAVTTGQRYDGEVSFVDAQLARLMERLRASGLLANTAIVVAGDHGEGLGEHGEQTHGMLLYDSTLRVPLFIAAPGIAMGERDDAVSLVDLAPTILALAGAPKPTEWPGRDLLAPSSGERKARTSADIYAETAYPRVAGWSALQMLTDGRWKAIRAGRDAELYDMGRDPGESKNVARTQTSTATAMAARIDAIAAAGAQGGTGASAVSAEAAERLRALGYVASSAQPSNGTPAPNPAAHIGDWNAFEEALALSSRDAKQAVNALERLAASNPDAPVFQTTYARAVKDAGRADEALALYRAAAKRWPTDAMVLHDLAVAARDAGHPDEAVRADQAAVALQPSSGTAHNGLGLLAIDGGKAQDAVREFTRAAELDPNNASYRVNLGNAKHASGDVTGAEQAYTKALEIDPRSEDALNGMGILLVEAKRPAEAVRWFERALDAAPSLAEAQLNLGIALQQSGKPADAAARYRSVLANPRAGAKERNAAKTLLAGLALR